MMMSRFVERVINGPQTCCRSAEQVSLQMWSERQGWRVTYHRAAGKLFQMTGPATVKLFIPSVVLVFGKLVLTVTQCQRTTGVTCQQWQIAGQPSIKYVGANPWTLVNCHRQLVPDSLMDWKPVKFTKHRSDVVDLSRSRHHPSSCILKGL